MPMIPYTLQDKVQLNVATKAEAQASLAILDKDAGEIAVRPMKFKMRDFSCDFCADSVHASRRLG